MTVLCFKPSAIVCVVLLACSSPVAPELFVESQQAGVVVQHVACKSHTVTRMLHSVTAPTATAEQESKASDASIIQGIHGEHSSMY